jgi:hypothetical protein
VLCPFWLRLYGLRERSLPPLTKRPFWKEPFPILLPTRNR